MKDYAKHSSVLNPLLKKGIEVEQCWEKRHTVAFEALKKALTTAPAQAYPDLSKPLIIKTDASSHYCGAVLAYLDDDASRVGRHAPAQARLVARGELNGQLVREQLHCQAAQHGAPRAIALRRTIPMHMHM